MLRTILIYGVIAGLIVCVPMFGLIVSGHEHGSLTSSAVFGYTTMLIAFATVFIAIKRRRDLDLGGIIGFWPALALGLAISFVASIVYVLSWEAVLDVTGMDFASGYANAVIAEQKAHGASAEALAKLTAEMDAFTVQYRNPLYRMPMTFVEIFPVGVLVSLISAALLRNRRFLALRRA